MRIRNPGSGSSTRILSGAAIWVELVAVFVDEWAFYGCSATRRTILVILSRFCYE
jgi:hypothetical protein